MKANGFLITTIDNVYRFYTIDQWYDIVNKNTNIKAEEFSEIVKLPECKIITFDEMKAITNTEIKTFIAAAHRMQIEILKAEIKKLENGEDIEYKECGDECESILQGL